jgi:pimeloyl-ACP methyl ester carboxylesterase
MRHAAHSVALAEDAVGILDAYGIERSHAWGISMGGLITEQLAINHPDRLSPQPSRARHRTRRPSAPRRLPAASRIAHCRGPTSVVIELIELLANADWQDPGAAVEAWVIEDRMLYGIHPFDEAGSREIAMQQVRRASNILSHRFNHPIAVDRTPSWRHRLSEIQVPALIIHGIEDAVFPSSGGRPRR